jgi:hypothetical protein
VHYFRFARNTSAISDLAALCRCLSEFQPRLKSDHPWTTVATQADPEQTSWRRCGVCQGSKTGLRGRFARNAGQHHTRKAKIWMIEDVEKLRVKSHLHPLIQRKPLRDVKIAPEEVGAAQSVACETSELAVLGVVTAITGAGSGIHRRRKRIRIKPLDRSWLGDARNVAMPAVRGYSVDEASELRPAALHDAIPVRRVRRT